MELIWRSLKLVAEGRAGFKLLAEQLIVQLLAKRNLVYRGSVEKTGEPSNGNFLCLVELHAKFDPVMGNIFDVLPMQKFIIITWGRGFKMSLLQY